MKEKKEQTLWQLRRYNTASSELALAHKKAASDFKQKKLVTLKTTFFST